MALFKRLREKFGLGLSSATIGVAGATVALGTAMQASPAVDNLVRALVPDNYEGMAIALLGLIVAVARFRSLGK